MTKRRNPAPRSAPCCRRSSPLLPAGIVLLALGLLLLFLCIPGWAWTALAGMLLIITGYMLISHSLR